MTEEELAGMDTRQLRLFADKIGVGYRDVEDEELRVRIRREAHEA